jgi:2-oxoglutarate dehydrogenase E1 component
MYKQVAKMIPVARIYEKECIDNGTVSEGEVAEMKSKINGLLEEAYVDSKTYTFEAEDWVTSQWEEIKKYDKNEAKFSGVPLERLKDVGNKITLLPDDKHGEFHRLIRKIFEIRNKTIVSGKNIDWGTAEALAFSTLIQDGFHVRLSGQDVERGTFSHRHAHVFY